MLVFLFIFVYINTSSCELNRLYQKYYLFPELPNSILSSENRICTIQSELYEEQLENSTFWAYQVLDSTAKDTTGILNGNMYQFGNWDECLSITEPYLTQYCLVSLYSNVPSYYAPQDTSLKNISPHDKVWTKLYETQDLSKQSRHISYVGLCVPAVCSSKNVEESLNHYLNKSNENILENITFHVQVPEKQCYTQNEQILTTPLDFLFCILVILMFMITLLSTIYDCVLSDKNESKKMQLIIAFSLKSNIPNLLKHSDKSELSILHGIKVISICMIVLGHTAGTTITGPLMNLDYVEKEYLKPFGIALFRVEVFVDTFFLLSGLLNAYSLLNQFNKKIINLFVIILLRYTRLTPLYAFVILYYASVYKYFSKGPLQHLVIIPEVDDCLKNWWTNLLYVNNYIHSDHICIIESWFLACDFQFFILGLLLVLLIKKNTKIGLGALMFSVFLFIVIPFVLTVIYSHSAIMRFYVPTLRLIKRNKDFQEIYIKSHMRAVPYLIGIFLGYVYHKFPKRSFRLSKIISAITTFLSVILLVGCVQIKTMFYNPYHEYNNIESGLYAAFHRLAWGMGNAGLLISITHGHWIGLKKILSWSPLVVLSKLVFGVYLIHLQLLLRDVAVTTASKEFGYLNIIRLAIGNMTISFIFAAILYLTIEAPTAKIIKILLLREHNQISKVIEPTGGRYITTNREITIS